MLRGLSYTFKTHQSRFKITWKYFSQIYKWGHIHSNNVSSSLLLHLLHWKGSAASAGARLVEQSVFDDLAQEPIEHLGGDLTRVCGGFGKFVL